MYMSPNSPSRFRQSPPDISFDEGALAKHISVPIHLFRRAACPAQGTKRCDAEVDCGTFFFGKQLGAVDLKLRGTKYCT